MLEREPGRYAPGMDLYGQRDAFAGFARGRRDRVEVCGSRPKKIPRGDIKLQAAESQPNERQTVSLDFEEIYHEVAPSVYRYLRRLTGSRTHAEDILQETFMKLHGQLVAGANISHPRAWLFKVATNLSKDEKRNEIRSALRQKSYSASST